MKVSNAERNKVYIATLRSEVGKLASRWERRLAAQLVNANGKLAFDPTDVDGRHIVYGWLEVGNIVDKLPLPNDLGISPRPSARL